MSRHVTPVQCFCVRPLLQKAAPGDLRPQIRDDPMNRKDMFTKFYEKSADMCKSMQVLLPVYLRFGHHNTI